MTLAFGSYASLSGLLSARPAADADQVGRFYFATDTNDLYRDNGTDWQHIGTARTYKVYTALLTQTGTDAPVATVLENTFGATVTWTRTNAGIYTAQSAAFAGVSLYAIVGNKNTDFDGDIITPAQPHIITVITGGVVKVETFLSEDGPTDLSALSNTPIEIRVYP